ncbi:uncharacterized protein LOC134242536 isoform X2 [Saccostrea cucullata]|uniref:uncharacterized protein LOC134242536 isoform X2 n=1 Tax=Saccostrea cuccullata TaxID=36930 RepID=UPI002ED3A5DA
MDIDEKHTKIIRDGLKIVKKNYLFSDGIKVISDFVNDCGNFEQLQLHEKTAVQRFSDFFKYVGSHEESLKRVFGESQVSETDMKIAVAEHLLGKISTGCTCIIDINKLKDKGRCKCGCGMFPSFGYTGIGHKDVWHGHIDLILSSHHGLPSSDVAVKMVDICEDDVPAEEDEIEEEIPGKRRKKEGNLEEARHAREQTLAQAIVFSLLQKQQRPNLKHFLIPTILISPERMQIVMYDAEYDVMLCSNLMDLFIPGPEGACLRPETVIIIWTVLHYRMFCPGLPIQTRSVLHAYRSHFQELAGEKWDIYSKKLESEVAEFPVIDEECDFNDVFLYTMDIIDDEN